MIGKHNRKLFGPILTTAVLSLAASVWSQGNYRNGQDVWGPRFKDARQIRPRARHAPPRGENALARLHHWNEVAVNASGLDHTPVAAGENRVFGEQLGPGRASRAIAIVHIAVFETVNAIEGGYQSYVGLAPAQRGTSLQAAVAQAAHDTLAALFPSQAPSFDSQLADDLSIIQEGSMKNNGIALGKRAAL